MSAVQLTAQAIGLRAIGLNPDQNIVCVTALRSAYRNTIFAHALCFDALSWRSIRNLPPVGHLLPVPDCVCTAREGNRLKAYWRMNNDRSFRATAVMAFNTVRIL